MYDNIYVDINKLLDNFYGMISENVKKKIKILKKRSIFPKIKQYLNTDDIVILMGMRQTGKTSLLFLIIKFLLQNVPEKNLFYFSLEDPTLLHSFNKNIKELEIYLSNQNIDKKNKIYIFIDEIQYLDDPSGFLKYYYDNFSNYKIITTGSSSFEMRKKFKDSLAGRKKIFNIYSLSFKEYLEFKNISSNIFFDINSLNNFKSIEISALEKEVLQRELKNYFIYGSHPKTVLLESNEFRINELKDIYYSYIQRDIRDIGKIENVDAYNRLVQILSSQIGNLVNNNELTNTLSLNAETVKKYIFLLKNSFAVDLLKPYYNNKRKEISKMPKVYFEDLGIRNMSINDFRELDLRNDIGAIAENFVFNELKKRLTAVENIFFWRTINQQEVDFVIKKANELIPIEVKYKKFKNKELPLGLKKFIKLYNSKEAVVITKDFFKQVEFENCKIYFIPIYFL